LTFEGGAGGKKTARFHFPISDGFDLPLDFPAKTSVTGGDETQVSCPKCRAFLGTGQQSLAIKRRSR